MKLSIKAVKGVLIVTTIFLAFLAGALTVYFTGERYVGEPTTELVQVKGVATVHPGCFLEVHRDRYGTSYELVEVLGEPYLSTLNGREVWWVDVVYLGTADENWLRPQRYDKMSLGDAGVIPYETGVWNNTNSLFTIDVKANLAKLTR